MLADGGAPSRRCFSRLSDERRVYVLVAASAQIGPTAESTTALFVGDCPSSRSRRRACGKRVLGVTW